MVEITLPIMLQIVQTVGILVAIIYYFTIMRNQSRAQQMTIESRNTQFFLQLYNTMMDDKSLKFIWKDLMTKREWSTFDEWWEKYGPENNVDKFTSWFKWMVTYEMYGIMLKRGFLDIELIDDIMSGMVLMVWDAYEPIILGFRKRFGYPQFQEYQEYLTTEIRKVVEQQHPDFEGRRQF